MDVDSQPGMEETILVGDDLMMGPPSPLIPPEIASHVLEGVDLCDGILRSLFFCLQVNDIEPFCQDEIALYRQCAERRDKELRQRLQGSEHKLGMSMPLDKAQERASQLESEATTLERYFPSRTKMIRLRRMKCLHGLTFSKDASKVRGILEIPDIFTAMGNVPRRLILASGFEGMEGFRQRWSLHGRLTDTKKRLEALKQGMENRKKDEPVADSNTKKRWFFW